MAQALADSGDFQISGGGCLQAHSERLGEFGYTSAHYNALKPRKRGRLAHYNALTEDASLSNAF